MTVKSEESSVEMLDYKIKQAIFTASTKAAPNTENNWRNQVMRWWGAKCSGKHKPDTKKTHIKKHTHFPTIDSAQQDPDSIEKDNKTGKKKVLETIM